MENHLAPPLLVLSFLARWLKTNELLTRSPSTCLPFSERHGLGSTSRWKNGSATTVPWVSHFWDTFVNYCAMGESLLGYFCQLLCHGWVTFGLLLWLLGDFCQLFIWLCKPKLKDKHTNTTTNNVPRETQQINISLVTLLCVSFVYFWVIQLFFCITLQTQFGRGPVTLAGSS